MKKYIGILMLVFFSLFLIFNENDLAAQTNNTIKKITDQDLQIGKLKINSTRDEVIKIMGKPLKTEKSSPDETLTYNGLKVYLFENAVFTISVTSNKYETPRGLKVGDPVSKLVKLYGKNYEIVDKEYWGYYYGNELYTVFYAKIKKNKVVEIKVSAVM